jgi:type VI secretion system protein ImpL
MLKIVFALVFIGLGWAAVTVFGLPAWWAWLVTALVAGGVLLRIGLRWFLARRAAGKLESALASASSDGGLRPEMQRQIEGMRAEFLRALGKLKASRLGASGRNALHTLPWYVIIGPPGSGKSTVLRNSGLRFPYLSAKKGSVRGVGGTRNCDWWLANEGILLDTAGRWTTEEDDQEEWLAFLDLLRRTRKGQPLNGILVSVGAGELLESTPEGIGELAQKLRERVDEVMSRLQVILPVYLIVTKCDLVSGFVEAFGGLAEKERGQIWGVTLPLEAAPGERPQMFAERLDRLIDALEQRMLGRMRAEARSEERHHLFEFSQQFEMLCPNLVDLVNDLFAENNYEETPILRGVYFTSATQEGRPIDRVVKKIAERLGIAPAVNHQPLVKTRSYFLRDVFLQVVFPDQKVAGLTRRALERARLIGIGGAAAAFAAAGGIALMPVAAYSRNRALAEDVRRYVETLAASRSQAPGAPVMPTARLDDLHELSSGLLRLRKEGPPLGMTFGFYQGDNLAPLLGRATRDHVVTPILAADRGLLREKAASPEARPEGTTRGSVSALHLHLLLTAEKAPGEPHPGSSDWQEAVRSARELGVERWRTRLRAEGGRDTPRSSAVVGDAIELYLRDAAEEPLLWEPRNQGFVDQTRDFLCRSMKKDPLDQMVGDPALDRFQIALNEVVGGSITLFQDDARVRGAYTRDGWGVVKAELEAKLRGKGAASQSWLLGGCETLTPEEVAGLQRDYLDGYDKEWSSFLTRVYPKEPKDLGEGRDLLRRYAEEKPLSSVWRVVAANLPLEAPPEKPGALEKGLARVKGKGASWVKRLDRFRAQRAEDGAGGGSAELESQLESLDRRFAPFLAFGISSKEGVPSMLDTYFERLLAVVGAIEAYRDNQDARALRQDVLRLHHEIDALVSRSGAQDWQAVIRKMLLTPFSGLDIVVGQNLNQAANRRFCDGVVVPFDLTLADRYPFRADGADAPLAEVEKFFHPEAGVLWAYFKDALQTELEPGSFKPRAGTTVRYRPELTQYLQRARQATDLLFPRGAAHISVPLQVRIWPPGSAVKRVVFSLGGRSTENGNWAESFEPSEWPARGALLQVIGDRQWQLPAAGDWALFRLLGQARSKRRLDQDEYLEAVWEHVAPGISVRIDFKPAGLLQALHRLVPPRMVAPGSACSN